MQNKWICSGLICLKLCMTDVSVQAETQTVLQIDQMKQMQETAVILARSGNYPKSLELLKCLAANDYQDEGYWQDYIAILCWAGQSKGAIQLAEERYLANYEKLPTYVIRAMAGAYQQQNIPGKALELLEILVNRGDVINQLQYGELLMTLGQIGKATEAYTVALQEKQVPEYKIYYSQSIANLKRGDIIAADAFYAKAEQALIINVDKEIILKDIDAETAGLLIRGGEVNAAIHILKKYVDAQTTTPRMMADYLIALRNNGAPVLDEFERICPNWDNLAIYGLQSMGDAYFRQKQYFKAEQIYTYILSKDDTLVYARAARAYCWVMLKREAAAMDEYEVLAANYPAIFPALAADGCSYIASGNIRLARQVFSLLGTTPQQKWEYQYQYADALAKLDKYHESQEIYEKLRTKEYFAQRAAAGMAMNKIRRGLYRQARQLLAQALPESGESADADNRAYSFARILYSERTNGYISSWWNHNADYKGNDNYVYGISRENYLGGNLYLLNSVSKERLHDNEASDSLTHVRAGLSYRYDRGRTDVVRVRTSGGYHDESLEFATEYEFNDLAKLAFSTGRRVHGAAGAAVQDITEQYRMLRWEQRLDAKNLMAIGYEWDSVADGNALQAYSLEFTHNTRNMPLKIDNLLLNYGWSGYDFASPYYESPQRRTNIDIGFSQKWLLPKKNRSWEWIIMASWGHDNAEPTDFSPYTRIEFTQNLKAQQHLTIGAEYGWRTNRIVNNSNLIHGNYQFDINYIWEW